MTDNDKALVAAPSDLVQSVVRALGLIDIIAESDEPMRAKSIAERAGLHLATTSHLLSTLVHVGYLSRRGREYTISSRKILGLNAKIEDAWRPSRRATNLLARVVERTGETAYLSAWHEGNVTIVSVEDGTHAVRVADLRVGISGDIHARASGKALLAFGHEDEVSRLGDEQGNLPRRTDHTLGKLSALEENLSEVRERGYAIDMQEYVEGVCGLAIPLFDGLRRPRAALSITAPVERFTDPRHFDLYVDAILEAKRADAQSA
ncbi:IclR family transcriptional regulator [Arthrobacter sp. B0490]|uniref:IclR family transcriptional regulator n=1 Tax=Arthrobacter sp. B0490 TaxID=2058891 RepID=UPI000CE33F3D|nr:IclR family transcriptional regulator [Arthrobacter sp. B0490]